MKGNHLWMGDRPTRWGKGKNGGGRSPAMPRVEQIIACSQEQCICGNCSKPTVVIGYETAEQLDHEPAKYFVRVFKREKPACSSCAQGGVPDGCIAGANY